MAPCCCLGRSPPLSGHEPCNLSNFLLAGLSNGLLNEWVKVQLGIRVLEQVLQLPSYVDADIGSEECADCLDEPGGQEPGSPEQASLTQASPVSQAVSSAGAHRADGGGACDPLGRGDITATTKHELGPNESLDMRAAADADAAGSGPGAETSQDDGGGEMRWRNDDGMPWA